MSFCRAEGKDGVDKTSANMRWYWGNVVDHFLEKQEIWGIDDPKTMSLRAALLLESPCADSSKVCSETCGVFRIHIQS